MVQGQLDIHMQKNLLDSYLKPHEEVITSMDNVHYEKTTQGTSKKLHKISIFGFYFSMDFLKSFCTVL